MRPTTKKHQLSTLFVLFVSRVVMYTLPDELNPYLQSFPWGPKAPSKTEDVLVVPGIAHSSEGFETGLFYLVVLNPIPVRRHSILDLRIVLVLFELHGGISHPHGGCPSYFTLDYQALLCMPVNQGVLCWMSVCVCELNEREYWLWSLCRVMVCVAVSGW